MEETNLPQIRPYPKKNCYKVPAKRYGWFPARGILRHRSFVMGAYLLKIQALTN